MLGKSDGIGAKRSFSWLITTLSGYGVVAVCAFTYLAIAGNVGGRAGAPTPLKLLTFVGVFTKVGALLVSEVVLCPFLGGWWLDICSLELQATTLPARLSFHRESPWTSSFLHWLIGMVFMHGFASFIATLREVLRPVKSN